MAHYESKTTIEFIKKTINQGNFRTTKDFRFVDKGVELRKFFQILD